MARFDFEPTYFWEQLILHEGDAAGSDADADADAAVAADVAVAADAVGDRRGEPDAVSLAALRRHVRLQPARAREALATALLLYLSDQQAARRGLSIEADTAPAIPETVPDVTADAERLSPADRDLLGRGNAAVDVLIRATPDQVNRRLPAALAQLGRLQPALTAIRRKQEILRALGLRAASPADAGVTLDALLAWYRQRLGLALESPEAHAEQHGFTSVEEFVAELALEYLAEQAS
jgi:hypothetical protein